MALLKKSSFKFANMLYERINGELHEIAKRPKHVQKLTGSELMNIYRKLIGLIQQKGFNRNGKPFSADDLVGKNQIDWGKDEALQAIILKYPKSQKGQSSILGLILYQVLFEDASTNYEITRGRHSVRYCSF